MNNEKQVPNLIKDRIDMKSITTHLFFGMVKHLTSGAPEDRVLNENTFVIIFTSIGIIEGTLLLEDDKESVAEALHENYLKLRDDVLNNFEFEGVSRVINDTGGIPLTNVTIKPYSNMNQVHQLQYFLLFPDQILGLTLGNSTNS